MSDESDARAIEWCLHEIGRLETELRDCQAEVERLRAALDAVATTEWDRITAERDECRRLLRELVIGFDNNPRDASSDQRLKLVPIMDKFIEAARAAGGSDVRTT